ncbi:MAG: FGGY-family carbohydrate kinase [Bauldia litoralis]
MLSRLSRCNHLLQPSDHVMTDLFIGLDAGSSVCKAAVFDRTGRMIAVRSERTPLARSETGRVEADPAVAWRAACRVIAEASAAAAGEGRIAGIGIAGAMVGAWVVGHDGNPVFPGMNWEDNRAQGLIDRMTAARPDLFSEIFKISGAAMQQGCTLPLTAALLEQEPAAMERARAVVSYKDWLRFKLTGELAADSSEAAVAPGDAVTQTRSDALIELFGLTPHAALFPRVLPSAAIAGHVTAEAAAATGLPEGLPVATGSGDVIANVIGAGGLRPGAITGLLGTTCIMGLCTDRPVFEPLDVGVLFSLPERHWFRAMVNVAGTLNLDWAADLLCPDIAMQPDLFARLTAMAESQPVGAHGVVYLPYLSESGIIAPVNDAAARASFAGLSPIHGRESLIRSVFEGVVFSIADLCDLLSAPSDAPILLTGGGGRNAIWCAMIAEVTGRPVIVPEGSEFGAKGAAFLAATALGSFATVVEASAVAATGGQTYEPRGNDREAWRAARSRYAEARDRILDL